MNIRNILLIGRTGSGKSTLANVLVNKEENFKKEGNFKELFKENEYSISETKDIQSEEVEINGIKYRIIDTIGIGDTKFTEEEIAFKLFEVCYKFREGLNQVLFVVGGGRITQEEIKVYNIIKKKFFDEDITKHTTIMRTNFPNFRNPKRCGEETEKLKIENKRNNKKIRKIFNSCNKIIYTDSPSLNPYDYNEEEIILNKNRRKESRRILLSHLTICRDVYKPRSLELINEVFEEGYVSGDEQLIGKLMQSLREEVERLKKKNSIKKKMKQLLNKQPETAEEVKESSLEVAIEIRDICKQM